MALNAHDLEALEHLKRLIVEPLSEKFDELKETVACSFADHEKRITDNEKEIGRLKAMAAKLLVVWGIIVAATTFVVTTVGRWLWSKLGLSE